MGHLKTFLTKATANGLPTFLLLAFVGNVNWLTALAITVLLAGIAYIIGDIFVLPATGNLVATLADTLLAFGFLWVITFIGLDLTLSTILYITLAIAAVEGLFYHPYLKRIVSLDSIGPKIGARK